MSGFWNGLYFWMLVTNLIFLNCIDKNTSITFIYKFNQSVVFRNVQRKRSPFFTLFWLQATETKYKLILGAISRKLENLWKTWRIRHGKIIKKQREFRKNETQLILHHRKSHLCWNLVGAATVSNCWCQNLDLLLWCVLPLTVLVSEWRHSWQSHGKMLTHKLPRDQWGWYNPVNSWVEIKSYFSPELTQWGWVFSTR